MAFFNKPKYSTVSVKSRDGVPKGVWTKCPETGDMVFAKELKKNLMVGIAKLLVCWICGRPFGYW